MMMKQYYKMEQDLFGEIEKEKKFSFHKLMMLLALSSVAGKAEDGQIFADLLKDKINVILKM